MTDAEISRYLWERMDPKNCWHDYISVPGFATTQCHKCGQWRNFEIDENPDLTNFFSPAGEALWKWAREQEWWKQFLDWLCDRKSNKCRGCQECMAVLIGPEFVRRLVEYLKEKEETDGKV